MVFGLFKSKKPAQETTPNKAKINRRTFLKIASATLGAAAAGATALIGKKMYDQFATETPAPANTPSPTPQSTYKPMPTTTYELVERVKEIWRSNGEHEKEYYEAATIVTGFLSKKGIIVSSPHNLDAQCFYETTYADGTTHEGLIVQEYLPNRESWTHFRQYNITGGENTLEYLLFENTIPGQEPQVVEKRTLKLN